MDLCLGDRIPAAELPLTPRFSLRADISSGDNPATSTLGTFFALFPIGNYFGVIADNGPGPMNFIDAHPRVQIELPHNVSFMTDLRQKLTVAMLAWGGARSFGSHCIDSARAISASAEGGVIPECGHWVFKEKTDFICPTTRHLLAA